MFIRRAISKFKADFEELDDQWALPSASSLRSETSSSRTISDEVSSYRASLTGALQNTANKDDLPAVPVQSADDSNDIETVSPLQKRSLLRSLQHNPYLVSPNESLPSIESGPEKREQSESLKLTTTLGSPIPADAKELPKVSVLLNSSKGKTKNSTSSNGSSVPSIEILPPATVFSEPPQQNPFILTTLPPGQRAKDFTRVPAPLASQLQEAEKPNGAHYDAVNDFGWLELAKNTKPPIDFLMPSMSSDAVSSTLLVNEMPKSLSNSISPSSSEAYDGPMESLQPTVTRVSQKSRESSPYDDLVIRKTLPTVVNDNDNNNQYTSGTKKRPDLAPPLPLTSNRLLERDLGLNLFVKRENSVPGDFPLDESSTSSSVQSLLVKSATKTFPNSSPTSSNDNNVDKKARRRSSSISLNPYLLALAVPPATPQVISAEIPEKIEQTKMKTPWTPKPFRPLQPIGESSDSLPPNGPFALSPDGSLARKMEELGRIRRMESRIQLAQSGASPEVTSQGLPQPNRTTTAPKTELRPQPLQEDNSSDVAALLREAYLERQQALQNQLDKALAELRGVQAENTRLTNENQSQQRSISQLKMTLGEVKHAQDHSLAQIKDQLRDATTSLTVLNKEKKGWQDKLDSMQHKLNVAERQVRCLDHLTRHKLESRQEAAYGQPKRRGLFASVPASTDVIGAVDILNEEIYQTCVQLVEGLERTSTHSSKHKLQTQKVLGDHLTAMMEDQATRTTPGYNMLLMQTVLEVFMVHWCSSIIEAFYPKQESFADLLVQLSAQTARTSGSVVICGKQVQVVQSSTSYTDDVKFNEWVKDIIKELGLFLMIAGLRMKTKRTHLFSTKTLALVKIAYDLRTAMAEKDVCGGLEVVVVAPGTPFQENWMKDAHADHRKGNMNQSHEDFVAGTSGIGLQRKVSEKVNGHFQFRMNIELKPKVILVRALNVKD